jgi:RHS repeat-associated protein
VYDDEDRIVSASLYLGGTASYSYDAEGQRVRKAAGTMVEEYVYDSAGHQFGTMQPSGAMERIELYAGARHLATYDIASNATYFIHGDWQGTERLRTNSAGAAYESCTNLPFGDNQTCSGGADISPMHFTGKPRDTETNLDYFGARYYNSGMARWMSPDWAAKPATVPYAQFGNPQSLNLYGYVTDNPVSRQDGDGHLMTIYQLYMWHSSAQDMVSAMMAITGEQMMQQIDANLQKAKQPPAQPATTAPPATGAAAAAGAGAAAQQQKRVNLSNVVENETSSIKPDPNAKPGQPGSAEDLAAGRLAFAEVANRVIDAGHPDRVASSTLYDSEAAGLKKGDPAAVDAHNKSRTAAEAALNGSNTTNGATQYRTRVGTNVTTPVGKSKTNPGTPVSLHYGPFIEGKHKVVMVVAP